MLLWGVSFVASKVVLAQVTPLTYMGLRFLIATALLFAVLAIRGSARCLDRRTHALIALTALAEPVAYFLLESYGLARTSASSASLLIATIPLFVMVVARLALGEEVPARGKIGLVLSIAGVVILVLAGAERGSADDDGSRWSQVVGMLLVLGAVFAAVLYITLARRLRESVPPLQLTALQTGYGALAFGILWLAQRPEARTPTLDAVGWGAIAFLVLGATLGAFLLYNWALHHVTASVGSLYLNGIPVVTALTAWVFLGERLGVLQVVGAILVLAAVWIGSRARRSANGPPPTLPIVD